MEKGRNKFEHPETTCRGTQRVYNIGGGHHNGESARVAKRDIQKAKLGWDVFVPTEYLSMSPKQFASALPFVVAVDIEEVKSYI